MAIDPIRPTDATARGLAKTLVRSARSAALATLTREGHPFASLASLATDIDGTPLILISALSGHTGNLEADPRASLLVAPGGKGDPLAHPRITLLARAQKVERDSEDGRRIRRRFLARQPKASLYADFPDFSFFALKLERASLNGGFGRAYELDANDLLSDCSQAKALIEAEEGAVEHMNADHADAVRLYATALLGARDGAWRISGLDPDGCDLALGDKVLRLSFDEPVTSPDALRKTLVGLAGKARAAA
ncbi:HugZ family pyridoxamine 5'-phosphate oxidase [Bosea sp. (in: a-proteobacteria)]|uniref:HugZ family pyridoxamine 5'-phosphate oxidase n=1 Tax=Bosea sp. (in: a-proteobacteria) TaxID=1871050 RepID=UPI002FCA997C